MSLHATVPAFGEMLLLFNLEIEGIVSSSRRNWVACFTLTPGIRIVKQLAHHAPKKSD
jgi:hypothetical protein